MFRGLINFIPFGMLITLFMIIFVLIAYLSARLSSFFIYKEDTQHLTVANSLMDIVTGGFFVLLAFIIINTWNYMQDARTEVSKEADYLSLIMHNNSALSASAQSKIRNAAAQYITAVRVDEWATMREGQLSPLAWSALENLYSVIETTQPTTTHESLYYSLLVNNMNSVIQLRRERLNKLESMIPNSLSYSIFVGAIFLAVILGIIRGKDNIFSLAPILLFASLLGFNLALAISFDYPYSGDISVSNKFFYTGILGTIPDPNPSFQR